MPLIEELVKRKILTKEKANSLDIEVKTSQKREEEIILEKEIVSEDFLFEVKSDYLKVPLKKISPDEVSIETLELIPEETVKFYKMIPLRKEKNILEVGMIYPEDLDAQEALKFLVRRAKLNYQIFLITPTTFAQFLKKYRDAKKEVGRALEELETELKAEKIIKPPTEAELERLVEEAPITKTVAVILRYGVEGRASDIHIEPLRDKLRIRFRLLGRLHSSFFLPIRIHPAIVSRIKILSNLKIDETRIPQDGRFSTRIENRDIDFRVATFPTTQGEKVAIRVLDPLIGLKKVEELGLSKRNFELIMQAINKPYGMILATGPTGCGKTTTLYTVLQILNKEDANIVTLEDPVEYFVSGINQSQIRPEIDYTFVQGLRHILRQAPDVIMVGEIRDSETATLAIHAALTGHILLSTLHTNNAVGVIPRLIDLGVQPFLIPPTLSIAIAQRLARQLCPKCRKKVKAKKEVKDFILKGIEKLPEEAKKEIKISDPLFVWEAGKCKDCNSTGFSERVALFEVLEMTRELAEVILTKPSEKNIEEVAIKQGMVTMVQDGILKVLNGITTFEEALKAAGEK